MTDPVNTQQPFEASPNPSPNPLPKPEPKSRRNLAIGAALIAALAIGSFGGAAASRMMHRGPQSVMLLEPAAIGQLKPDTVVAAKGTVAEVFGNKFILQDGTGRALVDTGPQGDRGPIAKKDESVTVQGHFDRGQIRAQLLVRADGATLAFGPPRPPHGPHDRGPGGPKGPRADNAPPPPPPGGPDAPPPAR